MSLLKALNLPDLPVAAAGADKAAPKAAKLTQAADAWRTTHGQANERIQALKSAVTAHCADAPPALLQEIRKGLVKLDSVLDGVDHRLADSLAAAAKAADDAARKIELAKAKALLADYIGYVKSEPLVAHMDDNPFNVNTGLKALLVGGLTQAAKAIG